MLQVESSFIDNGMQKVKCLVLPPGSSKEVIPF